MEERGSSMRPGRKWGEGQRETCGEHRAEGGGGGEGAALS